LLVARKKMADLSDQTILAAITTLDLRVLSTEYIDLLMHIIPNEQEVKAFNNYESDKKPLDALTPVDRFMMQVSLQTLSSGWTGSLCR